MIALVLWLVAGGFLLAHLASIALYLRRLHRPVGEGIIGRPRLTLLRPVCGLDAHDAETLESAFHQDYPAYEVIFCAARADDAAVPLLRRLIAKYPQVPARVLIGAAGKSANPKLDNVWKGWAAAQSDWICMTDANLMLPPDYLQTLVRCWGPQTGMVSSPAIGTRPEWAGGHLEAAFLNSNQARLQFAADSLGFGYAQGKTMFFNRPLLERAGGLPALHRHLAEDACATLAIRRLGLKVTLPPLPFAQPVGRKSVVQVWKRQLRWSRVRRDAFPALFLFEIANGAALPMAVAGAALLASGGTLWGLLPLLALWYGAEVLLLRQAGWPAGWRDIAALPLRDLAMPVLWAATFLRRGFEWRGTAMADKGQAA
ncbi:ceramide glucosyltransferase [Rhodobacter ferrooxidans]|uniref:Ceramide glucosyltransferase n=1 Tax=Rhodobacter ferrooxidans TaxID=371731 RepID=C8S0Q5_9RHOB|nr:ceramide glucosyltransferase [Rhodobacter sp. SW2]EEW25346.1 Ceramide glucosyltransferase [Rhodobacter sp. SW2]